jgi:glyoxalase/bleomycin resistance protein/dioxygenase superfamily protein
MTSGQPMASGQPRSPECAASLTVVDLARSLRYYREALGFEIISIDGRVAVIGGHGVRLELREDAAARPARVRNPDGRPDVTLRVRHPGRLRRTLDPRLADLVEPADLAPGSDASFAVVDCDGVTVGIAPSRVLAGPARRQLAELADAARIGISERRRHREESAHLASFRRFYQRLDDKRDIYYLFFSGGLLHWVRKSLSYIPADANVVLLGSALPDDELAWLREHAGRPFHHVRLRIDDLIAWEFLFEVNEASFGWVDSDCLVLNPGLFGELARIGPATSVNCAWSWDSGFGFPIANTFFMFVNTRVISALRQRRIDVTPSSYNYSITNQNIPGRTCYVRRPTRAQLAQLATLVPAGPDGRPDTPKGMAYFDTTVLYQLLARSCGYPVSQVRDLAGFGHLQGRAIADESSDELLHIGAISKADVLDEFSTHFHNQDIYLRYLAAEYLVLDGAATLPGRYAERMAEVTAALDRDGLTPAAAEDLVRRHLAEERGLSPAAVDAVVRRPS